MAEAAKTDAAPATETPKKGGLPIKTIAVVIVMLVGEAALIVAGMKLLAPPQVSVGETVDLRESGDDPREVLHELGVLHEKLINHASGRTYYYDTEILVQVKGKHRDDLQQRVDARIGEVRTSIARIWASAEHTHFTEPGLQTLTSRTREELQSMFGTDGSGEQRVQGVLIPKCIGFPADY